MPVNENETNEVKNENWFLTIRVLRVEKGIVSLILYFYHHSFSRYLYFYQRVFSDAKD